MLLNVYDREEVPNPLDTSEFELQSNINGRRKSLDLDNEHQNRHKRLFRDLKLLSLENEVKPKIINDTGSLKTTTMQCPFCDRIFNAVTAKAHIPIC
jgi:hypothetical protein